MRIKLGRLREIFFLLNTGRPALSTGVGQFSNENIYVLDQLIVETKTDLKSPISPLLSPILH